MGKGKRGLWKSGRPGGSTPLCHVTLVKSLGPCLGNSGPKGPLAIPVSSSHGRDGEIVAWGGKGAWPHSVAE